MVTISAGSQHVVRKRPLLSWRMILLSAILPLNLMILIFVLFMQVWVFQGEVEKMGLETKRYLWRPLYNLIEPMEEGGRVADWIQFVVLENGKVLHPQTNLETIYTDVLNQPIEIRIEQFASALSSRVPSDMSIATFSYQGVAGLCFYLDSQLPPHYRLLGNRTNLIALFLISSLLTTFGAYAMTFLKRDIRDLIRATEKLRRRDFTDPVTTPKNTELASLYRSFEELRKEMKGFTDQGILMLLSVTHDLKTPLTSIRGYLEAIKDEVIEDPQEVKEITEVMLRKTALLDGRISEILDIVKDISHAKQDEGKNSFLLLPWADELNQYFSEESQLVHRIFSGSNDLPDTLSFTGNERILSRAVINLFDNAVRFTQENDMILCSFRYLEEEDSLIISVEDSGNGVEEADRDAIFQLFYRSDKGRNSRGMGIGLASVKFITGEYGGSVRCDASSLGGALFEIRIPLSFDSQ